MFYVGRKDNMIKRFGHKVSLEQVQQVAAAYRSIEQSHCVWEAHSKRLGLFVKVEQSKEEDPHFIMALKFHLLKHLQPPFIPDVIVKLKSFPLSSHGELYLCLVIQVVWVPVHSHHTDTEYIFLTLVLQPSYSYLVV
jgi:acyl-coenzyme A synthetase/AMP-(fatty) acid ligase